MRVQPTYTTRCIFATISVGIRSCGFRLTRCTRLEITSLVVHYRLSAICPYRQFCAVGEGDAADDPQLNAHHQ